jgi:hypothetical protein
MNKTLKIAIGVVPFLLSVACTDPNKLPAETAITAAEAAAATLTAEVNKLAPEQVKAFQDGLAAAKAAVAKKDWKAARAAAEPLPAAATAAVAAAKAKGEELKKGFADAGTALADRVAAIKGKVEELAKAKKLPAGVTKDAVAKAKEALAALEPEIEKAKSEAAADLAVATVALKELAGKAAEIAASLKME